MKWKTDTDKAQQENQCAEKESRVNIKFHPGARRIKYAFLPMLQQFVRQLRLDKTISKMTLQYSN